MARRHDAINLAQGFPDFDCDPQLKTLVKKYMDAGKNQYAPMAGVPILRERLADKIRTLYGTHLDPAREITITAGATQAIFTAIGAVVREGDEVIILEPAYDSYKPSIEAFGGTAVPVNLAAPDFGIPWDTVRTRITSKTKLIIINSPHNPGCRLIGKEDLDILHSIAEAHNLLIISDEVYEHLVYDGEAHCSVIGHPCFSRAFVTFSFGKIFHNTGWKMGYCAAPQLLMEEFRKIHQFNVFSVNTPTQYAIAEYLQEPDVYLSLGPFFQDKRDLFLELMRESGFEMLKSEGSYFVLADYSRLSSKDDMAFSEELTKIHKVGVIPISPFYSNPPDQKVIRFCFAKTDSVLIEAATRMKRAFQ